MFDSVLNTPLELLTIFAKGLKAATEGVLEEKVFLEISQNSLENTCVRASF